MTVFDAMAWAKQQTTGSPARKALLMALAERTSTPPAGQNPRCWPGEELLASEIEQSTRTIRRHLRKLEELKLISTTRSYVTPTGRHLGRGKACNTYELLIDQPDTLSGGSTTNRTSERDQPDTGDRRTTMQPPSAAACDQQLPLAIPEPQPMTPVAQACQTAAIASARAERAAGKRITALGKYAAPRAADYEMEHGPRLAAMAAAGATQQELVAYLQGVTDPLIGHHEHQRPRPALVDRSGIGVQAEFEEPGVPAPADLAERRARLATLRAEGVLPDRQAR